MFTAVYAKGNNICEFLFLCLYNNNKKKKKLKNSEMRSTHKGKNLLLGANSLLEEFTHFEKRCKNEKWQTCFGLMWICIPECFDLSADNSDQGLY